MRVIRLRPKNKLVSCSPLFIDEESMRYHLYKLGFTPEQFISEDVSVPDSLYKKLPEFNVEKIKLGGWL